MEARPWSDGKTVSYRYHPLGGKPISLGTDKSAAIQRVLDMNGRSTDQGTFLQLWRVYEASTAFKALAESTQAFYRDCWGREAGARRPGDAGAGLAKVWARGIVAAVKPKDIHRYLRTERASALTVANREVALLSNLFNLAIEQGDIEANPCKQVRRNKEQPRSEAPDVADLAALVAWLTTSDEATPQRRVIAHMAEFAAYGGSRRVEFLRLTRHQIDRQRGVVRVQRGKQRGTVVWEEIAIGVRMESLLDRLDIQEDREWVFRNKHGNPYTEQGFKAMWSKLLAKALEDKVISRRFTFHDLRSFYTTTHKETTGMLPELHKNPATTARIYDRRKTVKRGAL